jgi:3-oxoacyl-[acyl-carrier protein] reductase
LNLKLDTNSLQGKNAFISGATGGIGKSIALALADSGCNLFLTASNEERLEDVTNLFSGRDIKVSSCLGDLTSKEDVYNIIGRAKKTFGNIDIVINSAGVFPNYSLFESDDEALEKTFNINYRSAYIFIREFAKNMVANEWGRIVNIGSSSAYSGFKETSMYCSTKHAMLGLSRSIHDELKQFNVRTICVSPSSTKSQIGLDTKGQDYSTFLEPDDVAKYVVFAISFDSNIVSEEIFLKRMIVR